MSAQGTVLRYPYLWLNQSRQETEGRKERPVCVVLSVKDRYRDLHHLALLAISSRAPDADQVALEIPEMERRRAGIERYPQAWLYVSEYNYDIAERSFYSIPTSRHSDISAAGFWQKSQGRSCQQ